MINKKRTIIIIGVFLLIIISVLILSNQIKTEDVVIKNKKTEKSHINCFSLIEREINPFIDFSGRIKSSNKINIISEVNGKTEMFKSKFEVGETFKKGEILISVKDDDIELELKSIKSQFLTILVQTLPAINMDFPSLGIKFQKYIDSFELDGEISKLPEPSNSKERNFLASRQIFANYYTIKSLENKIDKFKIRAPFDGVVTKALIDIGSNVIIGQPIGEFINPLNYEIIAAVSVNESKLISIGNKVIITSEDLNKEIIGKVTRVGQHINELTQSIDVYITMDDNDIKDGMYGSGKIICNSISDVFKIERSKIIDNNSIYIIEENKLKLKLIDIIAFQDDSVIIKGLIKNDCIANQYRHYYYDGMSVN
tara:strand:- start:231 stop:1337 length:1107 start_codon:yes stop_codon:yes gene_type:complete